MTTVLRLHPNDVAVTAQKVRRRLQLLAHGHWFGDSHSCRCAGSHAPTCTVYLCHLVNLFTPALALLRSPVLEPDLDLSVGQTYWPGEFGLALDRDVLVEQKLFLEFDFLLFRVDDPVLVLGPRFTCSTYTEHRCLIYSSWSFIH